MCSSDLLLDHADPGLTVLWLLACVDKPAPVDTGAETGRPDSADSADSAGSVDSADSGETGPSCPDNTSDGPFVTSVVSFEPGAGAGYGQDCLPSVVYGPPRAPGDGGGSLDVLALGVGGAIVVAFDAPLVDGEGPDLLVFENPFTGWYEPGYVAVSTDGKTWSEWPCDPTDEAGMYPGCAGVGLVYSNPDNGVDPTDPDVAGGDAFDLADLGLTEALYVRVRDAGLGDGGGTAAGFDLDAVAIVGG